MSYYLRTKRILFGYSALVQSAPCGVNNNGGGGGGGGGGLYTPIFIDMLTDRRKLFQGFELARIRADMKL